MEYLKPGDKVYRKKHGTAISRIEILQVVDNCVIGIDTKTGESVVFVRRILNNNITPVPLTSFYTYEKANLYNVGINEKEIAIKSIRNANLEKLTLDQCREIEVKISKLIEKL